MLQAAAHWLIQQRKRFKVIVKKKNYHYQKCLIKLIYIYIYIYIIHAFEICKNLIIRALWSIRIFNMFCTNSRFGIGLWDTYADTSLWNSLGLGFSKLIVLTFSSKEECSLSSFFSTALVIATPRLNKGVATVDEDATTEPVKVVGASTPAARVTSQIGTTGGGGGAGVVATTVAEAGATATARVEGTSYKLEGQPTPGVNPTACLGAGRLIRALDFSWPNSPTPSSSFLFAKIEEGAPGWPQQQQQQGQPHQQVDLPSPTVEGTTDGGMVPPVGLTYFTNGLQGKSPIIFAKQATTTQTSVSSSQHRPQTQKRTWLGTLPSKAARGSLVEGRDRMAHASSEADNCSKIALSTLSIRVNKSLSNNLNLVGSDC